MADGIVLSLCDLTGNMVRPWAEAGYQCVCVDLQHPAEGRVENFESGGTIWFVHADVTRYRPPIAKYAACFAFPPCTHLAVSGARWFKKKGLSALIEALTVFNACVELVEWTSAPGFVENPVSVASTHFRKPDFMFDPCDYGDPYTKKTCLWGFGDFVMPEKARVEATEGSKMHLMAPGPERANKRSATPMGFARAVFEANSRREGVLT